MEEFSEIFERKDPIVARAQAIVVGENVIPYVREMYATVLYEGITPKAYH